MQLKHHRNLTIDEWLKHPFDRQILMIASELHRADIWIVKNDIHEFKFCIEKALELLYLTGCGVKNDHSLLGELCRSKEVLGGLYVSNAPDAQVMTAITRAIVSFSSKSYNLMYMKG